MPTRYDIIGDIHGHADLLATLLLQLGYLPANDGFAHPRRTAIFVGDYVDRGPAIRRSLQIVRAMVHHGHALAIMGNHELNALQYATPDGRGGFLRPHNPRTTRQCQRSLDELGPWDSQEWIPWLEFFKTLPLYLDLGHLRVVHACWCPTSIAALRHNPAFDPALLHPADPAQDPRHAAVDTLLKGTEATLPVGTSYTDAEGHPRHGYRFRWWATPEGLTRRSAAYGCTDAVLHQIPDTPLDPATAAALRPYPHDAPPVFFGHYGHRKPPAPILPNVACIDLGAARGAQLAAYRWDGPGPIDPARFTVVDGPNA